MMESSFFQINPRILDAAKETENGLGEVFKQLDCIGEFCSQKVLSAFISCGVSESHFAGSTGYGYGDRGREVLEEVMAKVTGSEDALMRHNFVSGTHTLTTALFGVLRPGDTMLCGTGLPYDTIQPVIGITGENNGSLKDWGVSYKQVDLLPSGEVDTEGVLQALQDPCIKMLYLQRSRGYSLRPSLCVEKIGELAKAAKQQRPDVIVMVDNCYGIFTETKEPTEVGADLMAGSLIKNAGGGIARTGGYIAGKKELVEQCAYRLTVPGQGKEIGCTLGELKNMFLGLFLAPNVVNCALKTAVFAAGLFERFGYEVSPKAEEKRTDIIQSIKLGSEKALSAFCVGIQKGAPVDAFVTPEAWEMPGYDDPVIMAAGAFHNGASIELSADGPMREPFAVWLQGGLTYFSGKTGILLAAQSMFEQGALGFCD